MLKTLKLLLNQKGAMFGLDARITMAIFGVLSIVTGAYITLNTAGIQGSALSDDLKQLKESIEGIHNDIRADLHKSLDINNDENAFIALYDSSVLLPGNPQTKWLGPYVEYRSSTHPRYGDISLIKAQEDHTSSCVPGALCYIWVTYSSVPTKVVDKVNADFDGTAEASPASTGRIQSDGAGANLKLWFRAIQALSY